MKRKIKCPLPPLNASASAAAPAAFRVTGRSVPTAGSASARPGSQSAGASSASLAERVQSFFLFEILRHYMKHVHGVASHSRCGNALLDQSISINVALGPGLHA